MSEYKVSLDAYNGPLDLLLFLIRREEVDIYDIPIARITAQYLEYADVLEQLDPETAGEFLVLAATLIEIKSRMLLPKVAIEEDEEDPIDPRSELVRQLLEYKKFKDVAYSLEAAAQERADRFERRPALPVSDPGEVEIDNLEIWDLFDAFNQILEQIGKTEAFHRIGKDDTPIALHAADILDALKRGDGSEEFGVVFTGRNRAEMVGLFLALLELIRQHRVRASQERSMGPIMLVLIDLTPLDEIPEHGDGTSAPFEPDDPDEDQAEPQGTDVADEADCAERDSAEVALDAGGEDAGAEQGSSEVDGDDEVARSETGEVETDEATDDEETSVEAERSDETEPATDTNED